MSEDEMRAIAMRVAEKRRSLGMSYQDLADATGLSKSTLQRYETGDIKNIPLSKVKSLAAALQTTPAELMGWESNPESSDEFRDRMKQEYGVLFDLVDKASDYQRELVEDLLRAFIEKDEE